ncbi:MAG TPA: hypothetical protein VJA40_06215 [archaeon]|nr:hypothetical protein [archaeon]
MPCFALVLFFAFLAGCSSNDDSLERYLPPPDITSLVKEVPEVKAFLEAHRGAALKVLGTPAANFGENYARLYSDCSVKLEEQPLYKATIDYKGNWLVAWFDGNANFLCAVTGSVQGLDPATTRTRSEVSEKIEIQLP